MLNYKKNKLHSLEIAIPTYNRPNQFELLLRSIDNSLRYLEKDQLVNINISIHNNSNKFYSEYISIINKYELIFNFLGINSFNYIISGFNIGSANNCAATILSSRYDYVWFLPDDDIASRNSIKSILEILNLYNPCMIHGGINKKQVINYNNIIIDFNHEINVHKIISFDKIKYLFKYNTLQAQEHIYNVNYIKNILINDNYIKLINELNPALFSIFCCNGDGPLVLLDNSLGIFRDNDPNSSWRHMWPSLCLQEWPKFLDKCQSLNLISNIEKIEGMSTFVNHFKNIEHRPDILIGLMPKHNISLFYMLKKYKMVYIKYIIFSPYKLLNKIIMKFNEFIYK